MENSSSWSDLSSGIGFRKGINSKIPIRLRNKTKYFVPSKDRTSVAFGSPDSYSFRQQKIEGYETRLYYEFKFCLDNDGQTFFYTLTYNEKSLPKYLGRVCFDYEDLRWLLNGAFKKMLLRKYGTNFRYFVGAELGDGKGKRGLHNNPHYHILFFLRPAGDSRYPYVKILPEQFRNLVKKYWQGFDEYLEGYHSYKTARFGIAREGENLGLVSDFRAVSYVAKYVCKDVALKSFERNIFAKQSDFYRKQYLFTSQSFEDFYWFRIHHLFSSPVPGLDSQSYTFYRIAPRLPLHLSPSLFDDDSWMFFKDDIIKSIIQFYNLWDDYYSFVDSRSLLKVNEDIKIFRNRYCNKCRISQHVGEYALDFVSDLKNPLVPVPSKDGFKSRNLGLYLYRKVYNDVYTDVDGSHSYYINPLGIEYKVSTLDRNLSRCSGLIKSRFVNVLNDSALFDKVIHSDCNSSFVLSYDSFKEYYNSLISNYSLNQICDTYAIYKLVYEDRWFPYQPFEVGTSSDFPLLDYRSDYERFLSSSVGTVASDSNRVSRFLADSFSGYLPYFSHPVFLCFSSLFALFDIISDYFFVQMDDKKQCEAERISAVKRFHNSLKLQSYFNLFNHV